VTDAGAVAALAESEDSGFDVLVNCVGYVHGGSILECSEEDLAAAFDLNVMAMFRLTRALMPAMIGRGGGSIVNIASVAGSIIGVPNRFAYGTTKAAVIGRAYAAMPSAPVPSTRPRSKSGSPQPAISTRRWQNLSPASPSVASARPKRSPPSRSGWRATRPHS
jgi:NAD(P)-dependent dehydrogenase (short-subunit alcohol dehydrogenase family)